MTKWAAVIRGLDSVVLFIFLPRFGELLVKYVCAAGASPLKCSVHTVPVPSGWRLATNGSAPALFDDGWSGW